MWNSLILFFFLTTALYYLGCWAKITAPIHERYPSWLYSFMSCAACAGFWYGVAAGGLGAALQLDFLGLPCRAWYTPLLVGAGALVWTPVGARLQIGSMAALDDFISKESQE